MNYEDQPEKRTIKPVKPSINDGEKLRILAINLALTKAKTTAETLDLQILRFDDFGKEFIKRQTISPDGFIQLALQVTYYKIYKSLTSTYESASTRRFREGRVDNIRAATIQALDFAKSLNETEKADNDPRKMKLLLKAVKTQTDNTISAITGHGIDCHLLGLKMMAEKMKIEVPDIFKDPSYTLSNYFQLSTSQIPTSTDSFMCYGAVVPDGYGVSYNPHKDSIVFCVSSFRDCLSTNSEKFVSILGETLHKMKAICQKWNKRRSVSSERIESPSQLVLHRRIQGSSRLNEEKTLRHESKKTVQQGKKFLRHKSLNIIRPKTMGLRTFVAKQPEQIPKPQNMNLCRRYSEAAVQVVKNSPLCSSISADLMEIIKQENVELI